MTKWVYMFSEGDAGMRNLLGGKGANLAEMTRLGLPVPQGFTITTEACTRYYEDGQKINDEIKTQINYAVAELEKITRKKFGDKENPLLVSVRSGARASMPGMMDTILNLGLNEEVVEVVAKKTGNERWARDCYRRFIQMYSDVVMEVGKKYFEELIDEMKGKRGVTQDTELTAADLKELANQFKSEYRKKTGENFPDNPKEQLMGAIKAVFRSWDNPRANVYRRDNDIPYSWGTAVNVQEMAFGNWSDESGTGVAFTRDPATGERTLLGEFLINAQGTEEEAVAMIDPRNLDTLLHPQFNGEVLKAAEPIGKGLGASPGAACGKVVFNADDATEWAARGEQVVLVRLETSPEDISGMKAAQGILTVRGGMTSHAAVVARGMGTCCVSGCGDINMDEENKKFTLGGKIFTEGTEISLDGSTGNIYAGIIPMTDAEIAGEFERIMRWADKFRRLKVRTNADTPTDARKAKDLGAEGIGLCRTEHMFFEKDRIAAFREMICSDTVEEREKALKKILPYQQKDFEELFESLEGYPVTIRLLDPPLHEFLPTEDDDLKKMADAQGKKVGEIKKIIASLHEFNPMMGHRGLRLAITYPEIPAMQTRAIIRAALKVKSAHPAWEIVPEIMIPLTSDVKEFNFVKKIVVNTADEEFRAAQAELKYKVGTMIEVPRACVTADEIGKTADFFSFGTNDLTQMSYGFSRDDAGKFLNAYYENMIFENDPFVKLDPKGVGELMKIAIRRGKDANEAIHTGVCGEHGGDPSSVEFCHRIGLDYVSCSPLRVPIARLAAAQAAIKDKNK